MDIKGRILIVEPNNGLLTTLDILLKKHFSDVKSFSRLQDMSAFLEKKGADVILLDLGALTNGENVGECVAKLSNFHSGVEIILLATFAQAEMALSGVNAGAFDYITKPWNNEKLIISVRNAVMAQKCREEAGKTAMLKEGLQDESNYFWGSSAAMKGLYGDIHQAAGLDLPVLFTGECGCGKQQLAKEVHFVSQNKNGLFMAMDAGAISDERFKLKLLGRVNSEQLPAGQCFGKLELAQGGTLFINNIDKLSNNNQILLLNIINTKTYNKINSSISSHISLKFIFGAEENLEKKVLQGDFNEALYNRISKVKIKVPPLRERNEDILTLASLFLEKYCRKHRKDIKGFTKQAANFLVHYNWPGNVSELAITIEKAVILCDKTEIMPIHFQTLAEQGYDMGNSSVSEKEHVSILSFLEIETLEQMEGRIIEAVLSRNRGNISLTAHQLGISRQTLYNKMKNKNQ